jgi:hypothetical protein
MADSLIVRISYLILHEILELFIHHHKTLKVYNVLCTYNTLYIIKHYKFPYSTGLTMFFLVSLVPPCQILPEAHTQFLALYTLLE